MGEALSAACVAVGSELLGRTKLDRNSLEITAVLAEYGIEVVEKLTIGDHPARLTDAVRRLVRAHDVVVLTGGLGPTADDLTRPAVAEALGLDLVRDPALVEVIAERYRSFGREVPTIAPLMADILPGAEVFANTVGAAPGLAVDHDGCLVVLFPGVPSEMRAMLHDELRPLLRKRFGAARPAGERTLLVGGLPESEIEERVAHLYERFPSGAVSILASAGLVRLVLRAEPHAVDVAARLDEMAAPFRLALGDDLVGEGFEGLEHAVVDEARAKGVTIATAESCTGGLVGAMLTTVPGASAVYLGGIISYANEVKRDVLGVPEDLLIAHGAVSEPVACAMAEGARRVVGADWGLAITGVAGPGGGTEEKPVGSVCYAVSGQDGTTARRAVFPGDREAVRRWSAHSTLDLLRRRIGGQAIP
jgi:nicotinamide-nucleotide amidase